MVIIIILKELLHIMSLFRPQKLLHVHFPTFLLSYFPTFRISVSRNPQSYNNQLLLPDNPPLSLNNAGLLALKC